MIVYDYERAMLVDAFKFLDSKQNVVEDAHGNVSCRIENDGFLIKPSGMSYDKIRQEDIVSVVSFNDSFSAIGSKKPSVDTEHHYEIYARNPNVKSICHTHSPYATAHAICGSNMPVLCTEHADYFGHEIRCLPYADLNSWGKIKLEDGEKAVLLRQHGVIVCSYDENPMSAVKLAVALEAIAKKYAIAASMVGDVILPPLSRNDVKLWNTRYNTSYGQ